MTSAQRSEGLPAAAGSGATPRRLSALDSARVAAEAVAPSIAAGVIKRRPGMMALGQRVQADRPSIGLLRGLRRRYGDGPAMLRAPGRPVAVVLARGDVARVLGDATAFSPASVEKRAALRHFQPHGVLISSGARRRSRREFHEEVLQPGRQLHHLAGRVSMIAREEVEGLLAEAGTRLDWGVFERCWWRTARRVVLGDRARDDDETIAMLGRLRADANWAFLHPRRGALRARFLERLGEYVDAPEPGTLASLAADAGGEAGVDPAEQIPHWLFAFDAAGMLAYRALAVLGTHHETADRARAEAGSERDAPQHLPLLQASVLEATRLWPTTPLLLRQSTQPTRWGGGTLPAGTTLLVHAPFFHRDAERLDVADSFAPDIWLDGRAERDPALVPFSDGPAACPGRSLVLLTASSLLASVLRRADCRPAAGPTLDPARPLPATLDSFGLELDIGSRPDPGEERGARN